MKKYFLLIIFLPIFGISQNSTSFWEFGAFVGGLNYSGEITEEGDIGTWINEMKPEFGLVLMRNFNSRFALGAEASYGSIYAADKNHGNPMRNFIANTDLVQANFVAELNFKKFGKFFKSNQNTPFVKAGAGVLFYAPRLSDNAEYDKDVYDLYWGTFSTYNLQIAFGWKWRISYHSILSLDMHWNGTGTSYIEGFNLKDKANPNDSFYGLRLTYSYGSF